MQSLTLFWVEKMKGDNDAVTYSFFTIKMRKATFAHTFLWYTSLGEVLHRTYSFSKAVGVYMDGLGLERDMARQIALGGNDPAVVAKILGKEAQENQSHKLVETRNGMAGFWLPLRKQSPFYGPFSRTRTEFWWKLRQSSQCSWAD